MSFQDLQNLYKKKQEQFFSIFPPNQTPQKLYEALIALGKTLSITSLPIQKEEYKIDGCQSLVYLYAEIDTEGLICYHIDSNALISSGLAALLLAFYQRERPEFILTCPPLFLQELQLHQTLSPGRSNGLNSIYQRMKKEALSLLKKL